MQIRYAHQFVWYELMGIIFFIFDGLGNGMTAPPRVA